MKEEEMLFLEICEREHREIELCDARPSMFGGSFKRMKTMEEIKYFLNYTKETEKIKAKLRKSVGWFKYYFWYTFKFINNYNAHYYTR